jgi:phospholipase/carboxylesterase
VRIQPPKNRESKRSLLLLHGWTGDETVMWIFTSKLPDDYWLFAPRGPVELPGSGYGWLQHGASLPTLEDYTQPASALMEAFQRWAAETGADVAPLDVMGFSQGAGMAYALAALYPQQIRRVIALAGFLPAEEPLPGRYQAMRGKQVYVAHGTQDEIIPVIKAEQAVRALQEAGAQVTYCESDVGHKLSASCLRGLNTFIEG